MYIPVLPSSLPHPHPLIPPFTHTHTHTHTHCHTCTVLDQQLPQFRALEDMKSRANGSLDFYLSHAIEKPSRRKLINTRPTCLTGSSMKVKTLKELPSLQQPVSGSRILPRSNYTGQREMLCPVFKQTSRCRLPQLSQGIWVYMYSRLILYIHACVHFISFTDRMIYSMIFLDDFPPNDYYCNRST